MNKSLLERKAYIRATRQQRQRQELSNRIHGKPLQPFIILGAFTLFWLCLAAAGALLAAL